MRIRFMYHKPSAITEGYLSMGTDETRTHSWISKKGPSLPGTASGMATCSWSTSFKRSKSTKEKISVWDMLLRDITVSEVSATVNTTPRFLQHPGPQHSACSQELGEMVRNETEKGREWDLQVCEQKWRFFVVISISQILGNFRNFT